MNVGQIIKKYREQYYITMEEFAKRSGLSKGYISMLEKNENPKTKSPIIPSFKTLKAIANAMNIDMDELVNMLDGQQKISLKEDKPKKKGVKIPVLGRVQAGIPIEAIEEVLDYEEITEAMARTGEFFGLQIQGDSMEPLLYEKDVIIVKKQPDAESGAIVVVIINGNDATVKKLKKVDNGLMLISINPKYEPMLFNEKDIEELPVEIIGKAVELRRKF